MRLKTDGWSAFLFAAALCLASGCRMKHVCPIPGYERDGRFYCYTTDYFDEGSDFGFLGKSLTMGGGNGEWSILPPLSAIFPGLPLVLVERYVLCPVIDTVFIPFDCGQRLWNAYVCANGGVWIRVVDRAGHPQAGVEIDLSMSVEHGAKHVIYDGEIRKKGSFKTKLVTDEDGRVYVPMYIGWRHTKIAISGQALTDRGMESFYGSAGKAGCWHRVGKADSEYVRWLEDAAKSVEFRLDGLVYSIGSVPGLPNWVTFAEGTKPDDSVKWHARTIGDEIISELHDIEFPACPNDFDAFWNEAGERMRQGWAGEVEVAVLPELSTPSCRMSRITFAAENRLFTGWLSEPTSQSAELKMPVLAFFQRGRDPKPETLAKLAERVVLYFSVFEPGYDYDSAETDVKRRLNLLQRENCDAYALDGIDRGREAYFFYPVLSGAMRAAEWLAKRTSSAGVCCRGTGQGASLAVMTAGMSESVGRVEAFHPEFVGNTDDRNAWPHWKMLIRKMPEAKKNMPYYELCGFARRMKCPVRICLNKGTTPACRRRTPSLAVSLSVPDQTKVKLVVDNSMTAEKMLASGLPDD